MAWHLQVSHPPTPLAPSQLVVQVYVPAVDAHVGRVVWAEKLRREKKKECENLEKNLEKKREEARRSGAGAKYTGGLSSFACTTLGTVAAVARRVRSPAVHRVVRIVWSGDGFFAKQFACVLLIKPERSALCWARAPF